MKRLNEAMQEVLTLVNENEYYIIFNNGRAVKTNIDDSIEITIDDYINGCDYFKRPLTPFETQVGIQSKNSSMVRITKNMDLKIIHLNDSETYLDYGIIISDGVHAMITNIYYQVECKANFKVEIVCKDMSVVHFRNFEHFKQSVSLHNNIYVYENAIVTFDNMSINQQSVDCTTNVFLIDSDIDLKIKNVALNVSGQKQTFNCNISHCSKNSKSQLANFGISKNTSEITFNQKGFIKRGAKNTDLSQKTKGIILDLYSSISANPILEIDENDVFANHGASIGAIDDQDLYYLMSRGLTREASEALIVKAFINPYFDGIKDEAFLTFAQKTIEKYV